MSLNLRLNEILELTIPIKNFVTSILKSRFKSIEMKNAADPCGLSLKEINSTVDALHLVCVLVNVLTIKHSWPNEPKKYTLFNIIVKLYSTNLKPNSIYRVFSIFLVDLIQYLTYTNSIECRWQIVTKSSNYGLVGREFDEVGAAVVSHFMSKRATVMEHN